MAQKMNTVDRFAAVNSVGETPGPIPNPEAKPYSANGTATDRMWESRTPPQHTYTMTRQATLDGSFPLSGTF